jgi:hypothetical protein
MLNVPCVLVMKSDWLMKRALACILDGDVAELKVCVSEANELNGLSAEIAKLEPGVLFLPENASLAGDSAISQILAKHPNLKVIVATEKSNWLHIFRREDRLLSGLPELISLIYAD